MLDFTTLLVLHSYYRWIVLVMMLIQFIWLWFNKQQNRVFTQRDYYILLTCTLLFNVQFILGWLLFFQSLVAQSFWNDVAIGVKNRQMRFFGLEHMTMMSLGILLANVFTYKSYTFKDRNSTFRYLWKRYCWIYIIILSSIPWSFSPLISRPNFR